MKAWPKAIGWVFLCKRVLVELRGIRVALERQADALELAAGTRPARGAQSFRSYTHASPLTEAQLKTVTDVSYVSEADLAQMLAKEDELRAILGKDPTPEQVIAALEGVEP